MFYFKKMISYFDYFENGEKKGNCGYAKLIVKDNKVTMEIHVKDVGTKESCMCEIFSVGQKENRIGRFVIDKGTGYYNAYYNSENMDSEGMSLFDIRGLKLFISEDKYCQTMWQWGKVPEEKQEQYEEFQKVENLPETDELSEPESIPETDDLSAAEYVPESEMVSEIESACETEEVPEAENPPETEETFLEEEEEQQERLYEDKWQQLCNTYPVCHPFGEEEYISIAPKDFVVLRKEYQNLVNNSFLLHSFYNYRHVILGKMGNGEEENYYIGVPGNYFDREKRVAVMFGFEGFAKSERGNRKSHGKEGVMCGDFGYYMKKVEI